MQFRFRMLPVLLTLFIMAGSVRAQTSQALYYMNLQQRNTLNPALRTPGRVFIGLPGISDISVRVDNNFLGFADLFS